MPQGRALRDFLWEENILTILLQMWLETGQKMGRLYFKIVF